ncbi:putative beta-lysine N-acetyltransferase [Brevibacillus daliensis]|uniref:putative beta-lysine N-acetyltransferase n=1 Tax=Brevibacillus daliensis TaxID=2892995 RepID=UPI001E65D2A5|nr:putative beta-lysine N-acetyltransferase [Brevibacillus daliensis]
MNNNPANQQESDKEGADYSIIVDAHNHRLKVLEYKTEEISSIADKLYKEGKAEGMSKLIVYARKEDLKNWEKEGFHQEGVIDGFFNGVDAQMVCKFITTERGIPKDKKTADEILSISLQKQGQASPKELDEGYLLRFATTEDALELAQLYSIVFPAYPTPMDDPDYVKKTMQAHTTYIVIESQGKIVCSASAEVTPEYGSAELTDCATLPEWLGKGLLQHIFFALEKYMEESGIYYLYTITRAHSPGMNITAAKHGYRYRGRLINNCTIATGFEDMNIWVKSLR